MWQEMFDPWQATADEYIDAGDFVIAPGWLSGRRRESGVSVRQAYTWVFRWRDGKVLEIREYHTKAEALEALELKEQAATTDRTTRSTRYADCTTRWSAAISSRIPGFE